MKYFLSGFGCCLLLVACAGAKFPYSYYPYDKTHELLLGDKPEHDLSASACNAEPGDAYPCTCMMTDEFYKLKADNIKTHDDLDACQHQLALK